MKIKSLELENFRGFLGTHDIEFSTDDEKCLTLIVAENEVGKSTLLNAFVWCFYGVLTEGTDRPKDLIHADAKTQKAHVQVTVEEEGEEFIFKRFLKKQEEEFRAWKMVDGVPQRNHTPDSLINTLLPKQLSKYFLFSGEELVDIIEEPDKLEESIHDIQGLTAAGEALSRLEKYRFDLTTEQKKVGKEEKIQDEKKGELEDKNLEIEEAKDDLVKLKDAHVVSKTNLTKAEQNWDALKDFDAKKLREEEKKQKGIVNSYKNQIQILEDKRRSLISRYGIDILGFNFVDEANEIIRDAGDKGYPADYHKTIIDDSLADEECKLCERSFKNDKTIKDLLERKLLTAITGELQDQISKVRAVINRNDEAIEEFNDDLNDIKSDMDKSLAELEEEQKILDDMTSKIKKLAGKDKKASEAWDSFVSAIRDEKEAKINLGLKNDAIKDLKTQQKILASQIEASEILKDKDSKLAKEIKFLKECEKDLNTLIDDQEELGRNFIFNDMNDSLKKHSKGNHEFRFLEDTYSPEIVRSDGRVLILSAGAKILKKCLFFVTSLIKFSKLRKNASGKLQIPGTVAPIIVDAPFSNLDPFNVAIAARVLLESSEQLIVMINSGSFNGGFLQVLEEDNKKFLKQLGKVYVLKRNFVGPGTGKNPLKVDIFGKKLKTAIYDSQNETSEIEDLNYGK